ncbi:MAG: hypothetical protein LUD25_02595 [Coriobacteriaceae bacterium]|nr:hypothetical protein [Coriobacteriaceae bacterium]
MNLDIQWPLVLFSLIAGAGGALACFVGISELIGKARQARFIGIIVAIILTAVGGAFSLLHLQVPQNVMAAITNLGSFSGISLELMMVGLTIVIGIIYAILIKRDVAAVALKVFAVLSILSGLVLTFICGHGYVIESRAFWDTELLPLAYMGSSLPIGAFLFLAIAKGMKASTEDLRGFRIYTIAAVVISVAFLAAYLIFVGADVAGRNILVSWIGVLVCGIVAVIVFLIVYLLNTNTKSFMPIVCIALAFAIIGAGSVRVMMWVASDPYFNAWYIEANDINILTDDY